VATKNNSKLTVETLTHEEATRKNIPIAEYQSVMQKDDQAPVKVSYPRGNTQLADKKQARNRDLDPQLIWHGKDQQGRFGASLI
jgi:adenine-specific DNA-methyltransferase